jgi:hypothetical protein
MPQLAIINPALRPSKRHKRKRNTAKGVKMAKRRSAAQRAATKRLVAYNKARKANPKRRAHRRKHHAVRAANPIRRHRRRARASNPVKRHYRRRKNPIHFASAMRKHHRRRRRNPVSVSGIKDLLMTGAIGAGGALTVDLAMGTLIAKFAPANLVTRQNADGSVNFLYYLTKGAVAIGIGMFGKRFLGSTAETMATGAMVANLYDLFRTIMPASIPLGYVNAGYPAGRPLGGNVNAQSIYGNRGLSSYSSASRLMPGKAGGMGMFVSSVGGNPYQNVGIRQVAPAHTAPVHHAPAHRALSMYTSR